MVGQAAIQKGLKMLDDFVTKSSNRIKTVFKEIYAYNQVFVYTKDPLSDRIDLQNILDSVESKVVYLSTNGFSKRCVFVFKGFPSK